MLIYVESKAKENPMTQRILAAFSEQQIIEIQHYKNLFDKKIGEFPLEKALILAKQEPISILPTPSNYGFPDTKSFFFKPSVNCVFDCSYCYLKTMFRNRFPVIFTNYQDIQEAIATTIQTERKNGYQGKICFYASNYADLRAIELLSHFHQEFIPFFEQFDNVMMETRTKSTLPELLLSREIPLPQNTEIAFSLSPRTLAKLHEPHTAPLTQKLDIITKLIHKGYRVGLRFLPLLPVPNAKKIYQELIEEVKTTVPIERINSLAIAPLIESKEQRNTQLLQEFATLFNQHFPETERFRDYQ